MSDYNYPKFGAGLWHFANYIDRYAVDGYGPALSTLDQIKLAAEVEDLAYVDIPYPFTPGVSVAEVKQALQEAGHLSAQILTRRFYPSRRGGACRGAGADERCGRRGARAGRELR